MNIFRISIMIISLVFVFGLPIWNLARLRGSKHWLWLVAPLVLFVGIFWVSSLFEYTAYAGWYFFFKHTAYYWMIVSMMLFGISILWMLVHVFFKIPKRTIFWLILLTTCIYALFARVNGERIVVKELILPAENISREYQFVHITDLHHGSVSQNYVKKVVNKIQPLHAEFMVITGDLIDEYFVQGSGLEPFDELPYPIYLITGNHEYYLQENKINEVIADTHIELIDGMRIVYDDLDIIGVSELATVDGTLNTLGGVNPDRYTILLDHQPKTDEVHRAESHGTKLMLSGHTHNGQIYPFNWFVRLQFKYIAGLYEIGEMFLYVNQGTGTLGPKMRIGTVNEITHITLRPKTGE